MIDLDAGKVEREVLKLRSTRGFEQEGKLLSTTTQNEYIESITGFSAWAKSNHKLERDPLTSLQKADESDSERIHPRRALTVEDFTALLDAALRRPEIEKLTIRTGKNKGQLGTKVRQHVLDVARRTGINRRIAYFTAIWTGLRRDELVQLQWRDLFLDVEMPYIQLRDIATKSKRADVVALHPQIAAELRKFKPAGAKPLDVVLPEVPSMGVMKKDLAMAGINYKTQDGFADLHAQRMTLNMMLAAQNVDPRARQTQLRHTDPRLTETTYWDTQRNIRPQAEKLGQAAPIPTIPASDVPSEPVHLPVSGRPEQVIGAQLAHNGEVPAGLFESQAGTVEVSEADLKSIDPAVEKCEYQADIVTKWHDPASGDTGSEPKRAKGVEPSTFTLAT